jgi:3-phenylpropionate/cinnamic acid dioxygenase small subunit
MASYEEVSEAVRSAIAAYAHALDDGRVDDVVAMFCSDGSVDMPVIGNADGIDALRAMYANLKPRVPQRHAVTNTVITEWNDLKASAVSDLVFLVKGDAGWSVQMVGRYADTLHCHGGIWRFYRRVLTAE